ncbi:MAG TPA: thioredoxin family protein [Methylophilaceae bacterium]|nr:thioredoxin family protein [Methylophilaceae bacterium]
MSDNLQIEPTQEEIKALKGETLLEFGTSWCGYCQNAQPLIADALRAFPNIRHIKIEDGKGRLLGRTFIVKLWPTLIFVKDGIEISREVRPTNTDAIIAGLRGLSR